MSHVPVLIQVRLGQLDNDRFRKDSRMEKTLQPGRGEERKHNNLSLARLNILIEGSGVRWRGT